MPEKVVKGCSTLEREVYFRERLAKEGGRRDVHTRTPGHGKITSVISFSTSPLHRKRKRYAFLGNQLIAPYEPMSIRPVGAIECTGELPST